MIKYLFVTHPLFHFDFNGLYLSFSVEIKRKSVSEQTKTSVYWSIHRSINWSVGRSVVRSFRHRTQMLLDLKIGSCPWHVIWWHLFIFDITLQNKRQAFIVSFMWSVIASSSAFFQIRTIKSTRSRRIELVDKRDRVVFFTNRKNEHNCSCFIYRNVKFSDVFSLWQIYNLLIYEKP